MRGLVAGRLDAGRHGEQAVDRPARQRQIGDLPAAERAADRLAVGANQKRLAGHLDGLLHRADLQRHVLPKRLRRKKLQAGSRWWSEIPCFRTVIS